MYESLKREDVVRVIEGKGNARHIPMTYQFWTNPAVFGSDEPTTTRLADDYPYDICAAYMQVPSVFDNGDGYCWVRKTAPDNLDRLGRDAVVAIEDWNELDDILTNFPDPNAAQLIQSKPNADGKYVLAYWWYCFFERLWSLRGMGNALIDFYTNPDEVKRLFDALADFYCRIIERAKEELNADGIFYSDDIGAPGSAVLLK